MEYQMKLSILLVYYIVYVYILVEVVALLTSLSLAFMATLHTIYYYYFYYFYAANHLYSLGRKTFLLPFTKDDFASNSSMCLYVVVVGEDLGSSSITSENHFECLKGHCEGQYYKLTAFEL